MARVAALRSLAARGSCPTPSGRWLVADVGAARRRGVIFDFGNGTLDHFDWATVERATKQGFWPDTISTDWNVMSKTTGVIDFPTVMSKFIMFGMPLSQIIACATVNAARVFPSFDDRGTLLLVSAAAHDGVAQTNTPPSKVETRLITLGTVAPTAKSPSHTILASPDRQ